MREQKEVKQTFLEYWQLLNEDGEILRVESIVRLIPPLQHDIVFQVVPKSIFDAVVKERDELKNKYNEAADKALEAADKYCELAGKYVRCLDENQSLRARVRELEKELELVRDSHKRQG